MVVRDDPTHPPRFWKVSIMLWPLNKRMNYKRLSLTISIELLKKSPTLSLSLHNVNLCVLIIPRNLELKHMLVQHMVKWTTLYPCTCLSETMIYKAKQFMLATKKNLKKSLHLLKYGAIEYASDDIKQVKFAQNRIK
jgi:hypothetical protein